MFPQSVYTKENLRDQVERECKSMNVMYDSNDSEVLNDYKEPAKFFDWLPHYKKRYSPFDTFGFGRPIYFIPSRASSIMEYSYEKYKEQLIKDIFYDMEYKDYKNKWKPTEKKTPDETMKLMLKNTKKKFSKEQKKEWKMKSKKK